MGQPTLWWLRVWRKSQKKEEPELLIFFRMPLLMNSAKLATPIGWAMRSILSARVTGRGGRRLSGSICSNISANRTSFRYSSTKKRPRRERLWQPGLLPSRRIKRANWFSLVSSLLLLRSIRPALDHASTLFYRLPFPWRIKKLRLSFKGKRKEKFSPFLLLILKKIFWKFLFDDILSFWWEREAN
jgi:hypothetical protein